MAHHDEAGEVLNLGKDPVHVKLALDPETRKFLAAAAEHGGPAQVGAIARLRIAGLKPSHPGWSGGRVFLNFPDDPKKLGPELLSDKSPYYVGGFKLYPVEGEVQGFDLAPGPRHHRLAQRHELDDMKSLRVTIVGIPRDPRKGPERAGPGVPFSDVSLNVGAGPDRHRTP